MKAERQPGREQTPPEGKARQRVAAFDFDGTLTYGDTFLPFLRFVLGPVGFAAKMLTLSPVLAAFRLGLLANDAAKRSVIEKCLGGLTEDELCALGGKFAAERIPNMIRPEVLSQAEDHKSRGERCIIVTASLEIYVRSWALSHGFEACLGTRLKLDRERRVAGEFIGSNCYGEEKVRRLQAYLGDNECFLYAYGDSKGDYPLLGIADVAYFRNRAWGKRSVDQCGNFFEN
jgi:HAD-superfamily subfamily IB hydrolase, TIGR01490